MRRIRPAGTWLLCDREPERIDKFAKSPAFADKFNEKDRYGSFDEILADPYHLWMSRPTADIKADIQSGKMQAMYEDMYRVKSE